MQKAYAVSVKTPIGTTTVNLLAPNAEKATRYALANVRDWDCFKSDDPDTITLDMCYGISDGTITR